MLGNANPATHAASGGIGVSGPFEIRNARYELRKFENPGLKADEGDSADKLGCCLVLDCAQQVGSGEVEETEEILLIDNGEKCFPCDESEQATDGEGQFFSASRAPRTNSNYSVFCAHLKDAGFEFPAGVVAVGEMLNGIKARGEQIPVKDAKGEIKKNKKGYAISQLVVAELVESLPWEAGASAAAGKGKAAAKPTAAAAKPGNGNGVVDLDSTEAEILLAIVADNPKGIAKAKLFNATFEKIAADYPALVKTKASVAAKIASDTFLKGVAAAGAISFSGGMIKGA